MAANARTSSPGRLESACLRGHLERNYAPHPVVAPAGHYRTAIKEGDSCWLCDDHQHPSRLYHLPDIILMNACVLWLACGPHGGAQLITFDDDQLEDQQPLPTLEQMMANKTADPGSAACKGE